MKEGASSDMAANAVEGLLKKTNTAPEDVELVILATGTPDYPFPSTANVLCDKLGMKNAWGFDLMIFNATNEDGINSAMTDVFGVNATGIEFIPPRQVMARISYTF